MMQIMINFSQKTGLIAHALRDPARRAEAINEYNVKAGGLRALMKDGKLEQASTHEIPSLISDEEKARYLRFVGDGKRIPIIFAAGSATRMKLPKHMNRLGIAGLTPGILHEIEKIRALREEATLEELERSETLVKHSDRAAVDVYLDSNDLSFIQRQLIQYVYQMEKLLRASPFLKITVKEWLERASFAAVVSQANKKAVAKQLAAIHFGGLNPEHVYLVVQPEAGGYEILPDGRLEPFSQIMWPEGHGKPFIDMCSDPSIAYSLNLKGQPRSLGRTLVAELKARGVERATFAQVNDLHLLEDMATIDRWSVADKIIRQGADMVMEMVENGLRQKGGGIFIAEDGTVVMRDTIAMKSPDLEAYSIPQSLSRMFYELTVKGISKLTAEALPEYITERNTSDGKCVLTREYYSGDASSVLHGQAIQEKGCTLETFKTQGRIPIALEWMRRQDSQPGFLPNIT